MNELNETAKPIKEPLTSEQASYRISSIIMLLISAGGIFCGILMLLANSSDDLTVPGLAILALGVLAGIVSFAEHKSVRS